MTPRNWIRKLFDRRPVRPIVREHRQRRPLVLQPLEERSLLAVLAVDTTLDLVDSGDGLTSLREAVVFANDNPGEDTITFDSAFFGTPQTILLTGGQFVLTDSARTTIDGGALGVTLDGQSAGRLFQVQAGATATLNGLILTKGNADVYGGFGDGRSGGGIHNLGTLAVTNSILSNNWGGDDGGAIWNGAGSVTVSGSSLLGNSARDSGAIFNRATVVVTGSTVSGNSGFYSAILSRGGSVTVIGSALSGNSGTYGGAMNIRGGSATLIDSSVSANSAEDGGGIWSNSPFTVMNSTLVGNSANRAYSIFSSRGGYGGGILTYGPMTVTGSTIVSNHSFEGDGIYHAADTLSLRNTLIIGSAVEGNDVRGGYTDDGGNLVGTPAGYVLGQVIALDANGRPLLANNGGPTATVALTSGSPAIGAGPVAAAGATVDQRGYGRPATGAIDIGAYQSTGVPADPPSLVVTTSADVANAFDGLTSLREAIAYANVRSGEDAITFAQALAGETIELAGGQLVLTDSARTTIDGGAAGITVRGRFTSPVFEVNSGATAEFRRLTVSRGLHGGVINAGVTSLVDATISQNISGVVNYDQLSLTNVTIADNKGGGLYNEFGAVVTLAGVTVASNSNSLNPGGGIHNQGTLSGVNVLLIGNTATQDSSSPSSGGGGGGPGGGGGMPANVFGGGLANYGTASLSNVIVAQNSAISSGGGIYNEDGATLTLINAIVAENNAMSSENLDGALAAGSENNQFSRFIDPVVATDHNDRPLLADNGGPTETIALLPGSPAINTGDTTAAAGLTTDQRGAGFARIVGDSVDIGAFEMQNTAPIAVDDEAVTTDEDQAVTFNVVANDLDGESNINDSQTIEIAMPAAGLLTNHQDGSFTFDPAGAFESLALNESATVSFDYRVYDSFGESDVGAVTITITGVNDGPRVSAPVMSTVSEDAAGYSVNLLAGATDPDTSDVLNVAGLTPVSGDAAGITANGNSLLVDPNAYNYLAASEQAVIVYSYSIVDGHGGSVSQTATITITGVNDGPSVSAPVTSAASEDAAGYSVNLLAGTTDPDTSNVLNVAGLTPVSGDAAGITANGNSLLVDPNAYNYLAASEQAVIVYSYNVIDGHGGSIGQTATITISGVNDGPSVSVEAAEVTTEEGRQAVNRGSFADADLSNGVSITASVGAVVQDAGNSGNWTWSYSPADGPSDSQTVTITADDHRGGSATMTFTLNVSNVAPEILSLSVPGWNNRGLQESQIVLTGSYRDDGTGDMHQATVDWGDGSAVELLTVSGAEGTGSLEGTHTYHQGGIYTVTVTLTDDDGGVASQSLSTVIAGVGLRDDGTLQIIGTEGNDATLVHRLGSNLLITATFLPRYFSWLPIGIESFRLSEVDQIWAELGGGDDVLVIADNLTMPATVRGGDGNDAITAGGGLSLLLGGAGDDLLIGGRGRSILVGGTGRDALYGGKEDDILLGGSAQLDADPGADDDDDGAWNAVLAAWGSGESYASRVSSVAVLLDDIDDGEGDYLRGGAGRDLFFGALGDILRDVKTRGSKAEIVL